jgi:hypothetical protein
MQSLKIRRIFVALLAVMALGAVASASASASAWYAGGSELQSSEALATSAPITEKVSLTSAGVTVECYGEQVELNTASITPKTGGQIARLVFSGCEVVGSECSLAPRSRIESKPLTLEAALGSKSPEDTLVLKPTTGTIVAEYTLEGSKCALAGVVQLKGKMQFTLPKGREELASQEVLVRSGGYLTWGAAGVTLGGKVKFKLASGKAWSFH